MRGIEEQPGKEVMKLHSEKHASLRRSKTEARDARSLSRHQAERGSKVFGYTEQSDHYLASRWQARIASQPFCPREPIVRARSPGKGRKLDDWIGRVLGFHLDLYLLLAEQLHARAPMLPAAPVPPKQRCRANPRWMPQQTDPAGLLCVFPMPLALRS